MNEQPKKAPELIAGLTNWNVQPGIPDYSLQESELKYKNLVENLPMAFVVHVEGTIRYLNKAALALLGISDPAEVLGKPAIGFVHPDERPAVTARIVESIRSGLPIPVMEDRFLLPDNRIIYVEVTGIPFVYEGKPAMQVVIRDITESRRAQEALKETEEIFSHFLRYSPIYVFFKDKNIRSLRLSKNFEEFLGRPLEELIGKTMDDLFPSDLAKKMIEDDKQVMQNGKMVVLEEEFNGHYYTTIKFPIIVRGKARYLAGFMLDITDRKLVELKMRQLSRGIEQSPAAVIITDPAGHIEYVNSQFSILTGYPFERVHGKIARILKEGNAPAEVHKIIWDTIRSGKEWKGEYLSKKNNGDTYWKSVSVAPILDDHGQILNFIITFEDITDRKMMIAELISARQKAEESDRLKSTFLANMSHEIRTPMNAIVGFADMLTDPDLSCEEKARFSKIIQARSDDLMHLINDLLDLSRIESGNIKVSEGRVSLNALLEEIEAVTREKLARVRKTSLTLICSQPLDDGEDILVSDPYILRQVFNNLIDNAIKFTGSGSIRFGYGVPENQNINCFVADTGIGISPENQAIIFEHFRQAETDHPNKYGGTGLGLAICKGSLALIGGTIRVDSIPGEGSTFSFNLPFPAKNSVILPDTHQQAGHGTTAGGAPQSAPTVLGFLKGKRLLICEDDPSNLEYLRIILSKKGAEIIKATTGAELRQYYPELQQIDLVLIDIRLPDTDGWKLTREIRSLRPDIAIIAQTAYAMSSDQVKSLEAGCNDYIPKPINKELLLTKIRKLLTG